MHIFKKRTENWSNKLDNSLYGWKRLSLCVDSIIKKKKKKNIYTYIYKICTRSLQGIE